MVRSVDESTGKAVVDDELGGTSIVSIRAMRAKGTDYPQKGEWWIIDRTYGPWNFACIVSFQPPKPIITGSKSGASALQLSMLQALIALGCTDNTT